MSRPNLEECRFALSEAEQGRSNLFDRIVECCERDLARRTLLGRPRENTVTRFLIRAFLAAANYEVDRFRILIAAGAHTVVDGGQVLARCAREEFLAGVTGLLAAGVDANARGDDGRGALHHLLGHPPKSEARVCEILDYLVASKADVCGRKGEETPLHCAACCAGPVVIERLLAAGAQANVPNLFGQTPIFRAMWNPNKQAVMALLLRSGADTGVRDQLNMTYVDHEALFPRGP